MRFWRLEPVERPLIGAALESPSLGAAVRRTEGQVLPGDLDGKVYLAASDAVWDEARGVAGDAVRAAAPFQGFPWTEAICGCPVYCSEGNFWAGQPEGSIEELISTWKESSWLALLKSSAAGLARHAGGRYPVGLPVLRGPADVISAMLSPQAFCLSLYDEPERLHCLLQQCTVVCREVYRQVLVLLGPSDEGGPVGERQAKGYAFARFSAEGYSQASRQVWAPGPCIETQQDAAANISPQHYQEFLLSLDRQFWDLAPYVFRHLHSSAAHNLEILLAEAGLPAIEITVDDGGPRIEVVTGQVAAVQDAGKPVVVHGTLSADDVLYMVGHLAPTGLYIAARARSAAAANALLQNVEAEMPV